MRALMTVFALAAATLLAAAAEPGDSPLRPATRVICLDVGGESRPAVCQASASRLDSREDMCVCSIGQRVEAPVCGSGERPQAENRAFERARKTAAGDGSLVGDLYDGRSMCVAPRNP
jgi:hypothetical protein